MQPDISNAALGFVPIRDIPYIVATFLHLWNYKKTLKKISWKIRPSTRAITDFRESRQNIHLYEKKKEKHSYRDTIIEQSLRL